MTEPAESTSSRHQPSRSSRPSPEAWLAIKHLFWELARLAPAERGPRLQVLAPEPIVREYALRLLASADDMADRFEQPAVATLNATPDEDLSVLPEVPTLVGRRLGPYNVVRRIGTGGMGAVYEAVRADEAFDQRVAIKTLWRGADSVVLVQRFRSERRILASLEHPNIARLIDGGATETGTPYLVMELVDGTPIDRYCDERRLGISERLDLFRQVCAAVQHAHRNLVVHRDLKPSNVLVTATGMVKLLDFGVAKLLDDPRSEGTLTGAGLSPFTTAYASPEQLAGDAISTATDVFALGALLFVLLVGRPPFVDDAAIPGRRSRSHAAPAPSTVATALAASARGFSGQARLARAVRGDLDAITLAALREDPARRYPTVDALSADVLRFLRGNAILARPDTLAYRIRTFVRRRRRPVIGMIAAGCAVLAAGVFEIRESRLRAAEGARSEHVAQFLTRMLGTRDAQSANTSLQLGTRETVTQMLADALRRVPSDFPDDPHVRSRLYAAIGASFIVQSRMRDAALVLDSARTLARATYGPHSQAFIEATIDAANASIHRNPPAIAERYAYEALDALHGREQEWPDLYARALVALATTRFLSADMRAADSLARTTIQVELRRTTGPTMTRAWAIRLLAGVRLGREDWQAADSLAARSLAIADSLGATLSIERLDALFEQIQARLGLGMIGSADSLTARGLLDAQAGYGAHSREAAIFLAQSETTARMHGQMQLARQRADTALWIIDSIPEVNAHVRLGVSVHAITELWAGREFEKARSIAYAALAFAQEQQAPAAIAMGASFAGLASFYTRDLPGAERTIRLGLAACPPRGDLESTAKVLRGQLAVVVEAEGRNREADSLIATLPQSYGKEVRGVIAGNALKQKH